MTSLIKNSILKHLTKFFKDLAPEQLQLSAFKGSCELSNLQLEEKVLMDLLSFPAWVRINKATCDQLSIKIPWTKIKSVPIQMILNEVSVEVEVCDEFRDISSAHDEVNLSNLINNQAPSKYGFVDRVIDGITVMVNNVLITFKSKIMSATFNLSRVLMESRCPNWKPGELSLTRIKEVNRGQILLFKIVEWQTMRLEAKCLTDPLQAPLRLITNHAQCRLTIKKKLDDCSVVAARIFVIFEDILWVLTFAQFISAASFVEYIFTLIKRSPVTKKTGVFDDGSASITQSHASSSNSSSSSANAASTTASSFVNVPQSTPFISPLSTPLHPSNKPSTAALATEKPQVPLTGNLSYASLVEQKFLCYDLIETSLHLYIDKVDAHLYDDIEISSSSSSDSGGALQTTLDQIQVDCYPYSRANGDRKHWYKWFDPSPNSRKQWIAGHFAEFDLSKLKKFHKSTNESQNASDASVDDGSQAITNQEPTTSASQNELPTSSDDHLLSLTVLVKIKDYCMNCVATKHSGRSAGMNKFIQTDKDYYMPSEMPAIYLELNYFYYFDNVNRMMVYEGVPNPLAFMHLSPIKLLFDSPTLLFLNLFQANLSKALIHLNDLFPEETTAPKVHCRIEILMPQISLPAKQNSDQPEPALEATVLAKTSALLVKSGKVTLCNSLHDANVTSKLMATIAKLKDDPCQPINLGGSFLGGTSTKRENSCIGEWTKVWNESLIESGSELGLQNQLWAIQFEPVWMDFMNYDVDAPSTNQRLEPIVEPVTAYAFIHLNLQSLAQHQRGIDSSPVVDSHEPFANKRDVISVLVSVLDGSILANMDKVQFGFLQRLGMNVEKLLQQIKADSSNIVQMESVIEDTLELNLTAYVKDIKARLILGKKFGVYKTTVSESSFLQATQDLNSPKVPLVSPAVITPQQTADSFFKMNPLSLDPLKERAKHEEGEIIVFHEPDEKSSTLLNFDQDLDDCTEVADDASCLFLGDDLKSRIVDERTGESRAIDSSDLAADNEKRSIENLLIDLDEIEQAASMFAKVDMKNQAKKDPSNTLDHNICQPQQLHEIETESVSYLELSMGQLMVRRITETKRRQKF